MPNTDKTTQSIENLSLDNPLWRFSLSIWDNRSVRQSLISMQDRHGLNINLLLCALWLGESGVPLNNPTYNLGQAITWHRKRVVPLRTQRTAIPDYPIFKTLRSTLLDAEVAAEQIELSLLYRTCSKQEKAEGTIDTLKYICDNLIHVLKLCDLDYNNRVADALNELVGLFKFELKRSQIEMYFAQVSKQ